MLYIYCHDRFHLVSEQSAEQEFKIKLSECEYEGNHCGTQHQMCS